MAIVTLLQGYLANAELDPDGRLPAERVLAESLAVSRPELRKALDVLEENSQIWRHVGKGTFLGPRPVASVATVVKIAKQADVFAVMRARIEFEPMLARLAARHASLSQIEDMQKIAAHSWEKGMSWRAFEGLDATLHRMIASAAGNQVLLHMFDEMSAIRRAVTWSRTRIDPEGPTKSHHSFEDHHRIVDAIAQQDAPAAEAAMADHIAKVQRGFENASHQIPPHGVPEGNQPGDGVVQG